MPQPYKIPKKAISQKDIAAWAMKDGFPESYNNHAVLMASAMIIWADFESTLGLTLQKILNSSNPSQMKSMLNGIHSVAARIDLIKASLWIFEDQDLINEFTKFLDSTYNRAKDRRNEIAHGGWCTNPSKLYKNKLLLISMGGVPKTPWMVYSISDHKETIRWMKQARKEMYEFGEKFKSAKRLHDQ